LLVVLALGDFVVRGIVPAFNAGKNDFSDPYCAAWLFRHGQNPYDSDLATLVNKESAKSEVRIVPIYPATAYVLAVPLTFFSWRVANGLWAMLSLSSLGAIFFAILRTARSIPKQQSALMTVCLISAFAPFHTALHVANGSLLTISLCGIAVYLATKERSYHAGTVLAAAACLKPQLGIWLIIFYIARKQWKLVATSVSVGFVIASIALARIPLSAVDLWSNYTGNLHHWFGTGGQNDFTPANPLHFQLVNVQVVFYQLLHSTVWANLAAWTCFFVGVIIWGWNGSRSNFSPQPLVLASLLALSLLPFYHRSYDLGVLIFALCWALSEINGEHRSAARAVVALYCVLLLPGQAVVTRLQPHLSNWVIGSWWWNLVVAPYAVWALLAINVILLHSLWRATETRTSKRVLREISEPSLSAA